MPARRRLLLPALAAAAATATAGAAGAVGEPAVFAAAKLGTLSVTSSVVVHPRAVDMHGVWADSRVPCTASRRLRIKAEVDYIPAHGLAQRLVFSRSFVDSNCADAPNVGFTLRAKTLTYACPSGLWKPGQYDFVTTTTEPSKSLRAIASVGWRKAGRC